MVAAASALNDTFTYNFNIKYIFFPLRSEHPPCILYIKLLCVVSIYCNTQRLCIHVYTVVCIVFYFCVIWKFMFNRRQRNYYKMIFILLHFLFNRPHGVMIIWIWKESRSLQLNSNNEDVKLMELLFNEKVFHASNTLLHTAIQLILIFWRGQGFVKVFCDINLTWIFSRRPTERTSGRRQIQ